MYHILLDTRIAYCKLFQTCTKANQKVKRHLTSKSVTLRPESPSIAGLRMKNQRVGSHLSSNNFFLTLQQRTLSLALLLVLSSILLHMLHLKHPVCHFSPPAENISSTVFSPLIGPGLTMFCSHWSICFQKIFQNSFYL